MRTRIYFVTMLVLGLALSGCYQSAGSQLDPTPKNVNVTTAAFPATFTPEGNEVAQVPTEATFMPTEETITDMPVVTEEVGLITPSPTIFTPFPTYTPTNRATFQPTTDNSGQGGMLPTYTPQQAAVLPQGATNTPYVPPPTLTKTPTSTFPPAATSTPWPTNTPVLPTSTPTVGFTPTITPLVYQPLQPSATFTLYAPPQAVQPQEAIPQPEQTQAAIIPSDTPQAVGQVATISPPQATATALVFQATANAAATLGTQLAPPGQPTFTPGGMMQPATLAPTIGPGITPTAVGLCNTYLIAPGDTLSRIALTYGVTVQQIATMNNIVNPDLIRAGDSLKIPCQVPATPTPQPTVGTGQGGAAVTGSGPQTYMVEPGDTLYRISIRFNVSLYDLMVANGLTPSTINTIYAGQTLYIPASTVPAAATITPMPTAGMTAG